MRDSVNPPLNPHVAVSHCLREFLLKMPHDIRIAAQAGEHKKNPPGSKQGEREINGSLAIEPSDTNTLTRRAPLGGTAYFVYLQSLNLASVSDMRTPAEIYQGAAPNGRVKGILVKTENDMSTNCAS